MFLMLGSLSCHGNSATSFSSSSCEREGRTLEGKEINFEYAMSCLEHKERYFIYAVTVIPYRVSSASSICPIENKEKEAMEEERDGLEYMEEQFVFHLILITSKPIIFSLHTRNLVFPLRPASAAVTRGEAEAAAALSALCARCCIK